MINESINFLQNASISQYQVAAAPFLPSVAIVWIAVFLITMIVGLIVVRKDLANFWGIFILTQVLEGVLFFFTFVYPVIPGFINDLGLF